MSYQNNDELTFSQIFGMIKKSFKRAVLYVLASVILATSVLLVVKTLTSYKSSTSTIYVSPKSEITQQDVTANKAIAVQRALESFEYGKNDEKFDNSILNSLSINAIVPEKLDTQTEFKPTTYVLTLNGKNVSGITIAQQNELLDSISRELLNSFGLSEMPNAEIYTTLENDLQTSEYFQIADELYLQAEDILLVVDSQINSAPKASGYQDPNSGKTLADLSNTLKVLLKRIDNLKTNILINKIENGGTLEIYLQTKKNQANAEVSSYETAVLASQKALDTFPSGVAGGSSNNTYVIDSAAYENLAKEHNKLLILKQHADSELQLYTQYFETYSSSTNTASEADKTATAETLKAICNDLNSTLESYKTLAHEYNQNYFVTTETKILTPAHSYKESFLSTTMIILIDLLVAIVAYIVAFAISNKKVKREPALEQNTQEQNK